MKTLACLPLVVLLGASSVTIAADLPLPIEKKPAMMLYVHKSFGGARRHNDLPLAFGLRLQREAAAIPGGGIALSKPVSLYDLRFSVDGRRTFYGGGAMLWDSAQQSQAGLGWSSGSGDLPTSMKWLLGIGAAAGIACLANWGICDGGSSGYQSPGSPGG